MGGDRAGATASAVRAVTDAGPVIHLSWIDCLDVLDTLFEEVLLPEAVRDEVLAAPPGTPGLDHIRAALGRGHLRATAVATGRAVPAALTALGAGEREAILLTEQLGTDLLITDDATARRAASARDIRSTGTLGVLKEARGQGLIPAVVPFLLELRRRGQWFSEELIQATLREERAR